MSLTVDAFIYIVYATDSFKVSSELSNKYEPKADMDIYDIKESFTNYKIRNALKNPSLWMKRLENINKRLCEIDHSDVQSENDLKVHEKTNLPKRIYQVFLTSNRRSFKTMSWEELKADLKAFWGQLIREEEYEDTF